MAKGPGLAPIAGITPTRPTPSILTSARVLTGDWQSGVSWRSAACVGGFRSEYCDADPQKEEAPDIEAPEFYPYNIYVPYSCDWVLPAEEGGYASDAVAQLDAVTPWHVSRELMIGGTDADNESLASAAQTPVFDGGAAVHPVKALGELLAAYFDGGGDGSGTGNPVVHAPLTVVTTLMAYGLIRQQGDVYYGPGGSIVSPGPGYPRGNTAKPTGAADGAGAWMYVSGPVEYALGEIRVMDDNFNRRINRYEVLTERLAIHRFDTCSVYAAAVYNPTPTTGNVV